MTGICFLIAIFFFKSAITQWCLESLYREVLVFWCFKSVRCMEFCLLEPFQYRAFPAPYIAWTPRKFERREVSPHIWCLSCNILGQETPQHTCSWIYVFLSWYSFWKFWPEMRQKNFSACYSAGTLVQPNTEELISELLVGQNFWRSLTCPKMARYIAWFSWKSPSTHFWCNWKQATLPTSSPGGSRRATGQFGKVCEIVFLCSNSSVFVSPIKGGATQNIFSWLWPLGEETPKKHFSWAFFGYDRQTQPDHQYL